MSHRSESTYRPRRRRTAVLAVSLIASVCAATVATVVAPGVASAGAGLDGLGYTPITPCRVVSTVSGAAVAAGTTRTLRIAGSGPEFAAQGGTAGGCGIPDNVSAVVVSVTAVDPSGNGFLRVFAAGATEPNATFLNYTTGTGITNTGAVKLATSGVADLAVAAHTNDTDVVIDVQGYYGASAVKYRAITPCRVLNTVAGSGTPFAPNESRQIQVAGTGANFAAQGGKADGCGIPDGANAVEVSITAVGGTGNGYVRTAKAGTADADMKGTLLNYTSAQNITNTATVDLAPSGTLDLKIRNLGATADLVVDVQGYYSPANTGFFVPIAPCRVLNTKARDARLAANGARGVHVAGTFFNYAAQGIPGTSTGCGIDEDATAVAASVTAVEPTGDGYVRAWPTGVTPPTATMLNYADARPITNTGALALAANGTLDLVVRNFAGSADLVIDVNGYFADSADSTPARMPSLSNAVSCVVKDSGQIDPYVPFNTEAMKCRGANGVGQLGDNSNSQTSTTPKQVITGSNTYLTDVAQADGGELHSCAVTTSRAVYCWGANGFGKLGYPTNLEYSRTANPAKLGTAKAIQVDAGVQSTCATTTTGSVLCWGRNGFGEFGNGTTTASTTPQAASAIDDAVQVTVYDKHSCALRETGTVRCWGNNADGALGNGTTTNSLLPVNVPGLTGVTQVAAGNGSTCALVRGGDVKCWGANNFGQLGDGTTTKRTSPVAVKLTAPAIKIAVGSRFACALLIDGRVNCWGDGTDGRLGNGTTVVATSPDAVETTVVLPALPPFPPRVFVIAFVGNSDLALTFAHACAMTADTGTMRCWGDNNAGQLGDGTTTDRSRAVTAAGMP